MKRGEILHIVQEYPYEGETSAGIFIVNTDFDQEEVWCKFCGGEPKGYESAIDYTEYLIAKSIISPVAHTDLRLYENNGRREWSSFEELGDVLGWVRDEK